MKHSIFLIMILLGGFLTSCTTSGSNTTDSTDSLNGNTFQNPVLGGDYPDLSVVRVGEDYYLTLGQFLSLRAGLYAFGEGNVRFDNFTYMPLLDTLKQDSNLVN